MHGVCEIEKMCCGLTFHRNVDLANHIKYKHSKVDLLSNDRLSNFRKWANAINDERWGLTVEETRICPVCGSSFVVKFRERAKYKERTRCSPRCSRYRELKKTPHAEDLLFDRLRFLGFKRQKCVYDSSLRCMVDFYHNIKNVWVESDGPWHWEVMGNSSQFQKQLIRDNFVERKAVDSGCLLIRVDNDNYTIEEQFNFITEKINSWDGVTGLVVKLWKSVSNETPVL